MKYLFFMIAIYYTLPVIAQQRILFIGDSVTDGGWGNSGGKTQPAAKRNHADKNHIYGHSYMMLCASELESKYPQKGYVFLNRGISGDDIERLTARWHSDAIETTPDVLSLLEGTNDVLYFLDSIAAKGISPVDARFDMDAWEKKYRQLLETSREANPQICILLGKPFVAKVGKIGERADFPLRRNLINEMGKRIENIAKDFDAIVLPFPELFRKLQDKYGNVAADYWIWDGIHPTPAGHRCMADIWLKKFKRKAR